MNAKIRRCNAWRQGRETLTYAVVNICSLKKNIYICNLLACLFSVISALSTFCLRSIFMETCWQSKRRKAPFVVSHLSHYCSQFLCVSSLCSGHVNRSCTDWKSFTPRLRFALRTEKKICTPRQCSTMSMGEIFLIHKPLFTEATPGFLVFLVDNYVIEHCVFILALSVPP